MAVGKEEFVEIVKPRSDKREYRRVVLRNSLQVLLISDPDTDKCAASMDVRVGSFSDPEGLHGLAHFLEHMLFYASEKYPVEDSYKKFISEVSLLRQLKKQDLLDFFDQYIKVGGPEKKTLSVRAYGNQHLSDYEVEKNQVPDPSTVRIGDLFAFRRSQPLYGSLKGVNGWMKV